MMVSVPCDADCWPQTWTGDINASPTAQAQRQIAEAPGNRLCWCPALHLVLDKVIPMAILRFLVPLLPTPYISLPCP